MKFMIISMVVAVLSLQCFGPAQTLPVEMDPSQSENPLMMLLSLLANAQESQQAEPEPQQQQAAQPEPVAEAVPAPQTQNSESNGDASQSNDQGFMPDAIINFLTHGGFGSLRGDNENSEHERAAGNESVETQIQAPPTAADDKKEEATMPRIILIDEDGTQHELDPNSIVCVNDAPEAQKEETAAPAAQNTPAIVPVATNTAAPVTVVDAPPQKQESIVPVVQPATSVVVPVPAPAVQATIPTATVQVAAPAKDAESHVVTVPIMLSPAANATPQNVPIVATSASLPQMSQHVDPINPALTHVSFIVPTASLTPNVAAQPAAPTVVPVKITKVA